MQNAKNQDVQESLKTVPTKEKLAYGFGCLGQNMIYTFMGSFLLYFYTDIFGLLPAAAGLLLLIARIWDAVNDPMMGMIVDRTHTRWGKFRPYLLFTPFLFAALGVLCFLAPELSPTGKLIYAYITYIAFGMVYTASDVPYWALSGAITVDPQERNKVVVFPRFVGTVGAAAATVGTLPLIYLFRNIFGGNIVRGYQMTALVYGIITIITFLVAFVFVKERVVAKDQEHASLRDTLRTFSQNTPLLLIIIAGFFTGVAQTAKLQGLIYYARYNLANEGLYTILVGVNIPFILLGIVLVPMFTKRFGKKHVYIGSSVIFALSSLGFFLSGWNNFLLILFWNCLGSLGMAVPMVIQTSMIADTIEYAELKTGKRSEGTIFSSQTFLAKLTAAAASGILGFSLTFMGFKAGITQSQNVLMGIHSITALIPFFGSVFGIIPILFYTLTESRHAEIVAELERKALI